MKLNGILSKICSVYKPGNSNCNCDLCLCIIKNANYINKINIESKCMDTVKFLLDKT